MLKKLVRFIGGDPHKREIDKFTDLVDEINALEAAYEKLSDEALSAKTVEFRARLAQDEALDDLLVEAFAVVREASKRTIGQRHYDVQMIGGIALHRGKISEMRTGEGKTLVATLPIYLNALTGKGVHLITVNDYLARRDARWMAPIYNMLGLSVGVLQMAARTENGKKAFLIDTEKESPHEDQHQLRMVPRQEAYAADITYGTNSEFGFDYLRDNMGMHLEDRVQRGHYYAVVDEVDNVLIDEARTPLIISGPAQDESEWYMRVAQVVKQLRPEDYEINEKDRTASLTEIGEAHIEELLGESLRDPERPEDITHEQARMMGYVEQAMRAQFLYHRNKEYLVQAGKVVIVDEFTGRLMPGRRWSDGLHQAVEAKEGVKVQSESVTYATITIQNYFRMYEKLAGMTGTAITEAEEFDKIYKLGVLVIPTNLEYQAARDGSELLELQDKDEQGYKYTYYARKDQTERKAVYWKRKDYPDVIYRTEEAKLRAIAWEILRYNILGRPVLVGTTSVELSERVSTRLRAEPLRRLALTNILRDVWMHKNDRTDDIRQIPELQFLNEPLDKLDIAEMRKLARDLGTSFNPEDPANITYLLGLLGLTDKQHARLVEALKAGISHEVLNARKHTEESQIIAGAGAFGAVTIATNMAGRGVDIRLGGELAEEIIAIVNRVLTRSGHDNPYEMTMLERRQALMKMSPEDYGIYDAEVKYFMNFMEEMDQVHRLGGLHVIGSERHEARRIDNQLRGRAARQGDPGSSRFYLSMEDYLMRLFGGQQADAMMQRMKVDDAFPLELGLVGRMVEQSQTRVEGANFDVRKHLLEYDDVLNSQRAHIYSQRDRIFTKEDLTDDITEMLRTEVSRRVPQALEDEGGPWRLLAWLDQVQPPLNINNALFPSFTLHLLHQEAQRRLPAGANAQAVRTVLLDIARESLKAEQQHLLKTVTTLIEQFGTRLEAQLAERFEAIDMFFEGLSVDEEASSRKPIELANELSAAARMPLKLSNEAQRALRDQPEQITDEIREQVENTLVSQTMMRLVGTIEHRLEENLSLPPADSIEDWDTFEEQLLQIAEEAIARRVERYTGENGLITRDLDNSLARINGNLNEAALLQLLYLIPQGARSTFDKKTHRRVWQRTTRLNYVYYAAHLLDDRPSDEIADEVLEHLEKAQELLRTAWGAMEWMRLANASISDLEEKAGWRLMEAIGETRPDSPVLSQPLNSLSAEQRIAVIEMLGGMALTEIYRQLLLSIITELWVDYLTQMEGLRVSIGLEAYAQRDPLVQYKSRASELFQNLLSEMRLGVISRMFTFRVRDASSVQTSTDHAEIAQAELSEDQVELLGENPKEEPLKTDSATVQAEAQQSGEDGKKRRRRRH